MMNNEFSTNEEWIKLKEDEIPKGDRYAVTKIVEDEIGTKIFLDNGISAIEVFFDGVPLLTRNSCIDGVRMRTWSEAQEKYDDYFFSKDFFFEVKNSRLVDWIIEESYGVYEKEKITHYCIVADDGFIDIVATFEPKVTISKMGE